MNKKKLFKRENYLSKIRGFYHANDLIKVITGVRRCGKSSILQMISQELLDEGISEKVQNGMIGVKGPIQSRMDVVFMRIFFSATNPMIN